VHIQFTFFSSVTQVNAGEKIRHTVHLCDYDLPYSSKSHISYLYIPYVHLKDKQYIPTVLIYHSSIMYS